MTKIKVIDQNEYLCFSFCNNLWGVDPVGEYNMMAGRREIAGGMGFTSEDKARQYFNRRTKQMQRRFGGVT